MHQEQHSTENVLPRAAEPALDMSFLPGYIGFAAGYTGGLSLATALLALVGLRASIKLHNTTLRAVRTARRPCSAQQCQVNRCLESMTHNFYAGTSVCFMSCARFWFDDTKRLHGAPELAQMQGP